MPTINLAEAEQVLAGSKAKIFEMGVKMSVSVTDSRGDLIAMNALFGVHVLFLFTPI